MLRFSLFGFDVQVQPFFWVMAFLLGMQRGFLEAGPQYLIAIWIVVVFASVLLHELGHAFAFRRLHMKAHIVLHSWGGYTVPNELLPPSRGQRAIVNLAGPFAGFVPAALIWAFERFAPSAYLALPMPIAFAFECAFEVGLFWGVFNLLPLLPLDGGHVVQNACGPRRARLAAVICSIAPLDIGAWAALRHNWFLAFYMGYFLFQAAKAFSEGKIEEAKAGATAAVVEMPLEAAALIVSARHALAEGEPARAVKLARRVLEGDGGSFAATKQASREAYEVAAWAAMLEDRTDAAAEALTEAQRLGSVDAALAGAVLFARGDAAGARRVLEAARAKGDTRKEIAGPLIQILIGQGDVARAAAIALDIVDQLNDDDTRKIASIAFDARAFEWAARLDEALFARTRHGDDAYDAARALACDGDVDRAIDMLRRAVAAGFSDRARAWSDAALEKLRAGKLDQVLPRP